MAHLAFVGNNVKGYIFVLGNSLPEPQIATEEYLSCACRLRHYRDATRADFLRSTFALGFFLLRDIVGASLIPRGGYGTRNCSGR